ncbi:MarR family winged helix-turn-helix transcriptional regulator [Branchiibius sp. NY16-3462-2]|uniref:MarR family winged helix-turn-helix transcriptional regulator n=1 Tax=Branchiibius sp. NY16-3462-2 TaxID=1807500 RepID=UPI00079A20F3|nr:MarR family transcriptional regulator [Branchiibius sp. NY16-3462-2]KYH44913.1 MarR family transcriptional regulator [Branchiibius sp. NY16-3462-2]
MSDDPLALENQVCYGLALAARGIIGAYRPVLEPLGLTHPQYLVMLALWERHPQSNRQLSDALRLDPGTITPLIKRLEREGYVTRQRQAGNERTLDIDLTERGIALRDRAVHVPLIMIRRLGLKPADLPALADTLHGLIAAADNPLPLTDAERAALTSPH